MVAEIEGDGGRAVAVQADVAQAAYVERLFPEAKTTFGRLDIVVNSAGIYECGFRTPSRTESSLDV